MQNPLCFLVVFLLFPATLVRSEDLHTLRGKQQAQERAQALAGELISSVLDVQIRQLEENGLTELPIYRDVRAMRASIGSLRTSQMEGIVHLLVDAQAGSSADRAAKISAARGKIRDVAAQLMAERQRLYRRMQVAKLSADVRELVSLQTKTHDTTRSLLEQPALERERLALATIEDQADVQKLYLQLLAALADVGGWGGQAAAGALDGLRILRAAQVEPELTQAGEALVGAAFAAAAESQLAALKGLAALLDKLDETQGLNDGDRAAALALVRELLARQQQLRQQTKTVLLTQRNAAPLIEQQTALQKELGKLAGALTKFSTADPLLEQAKEASLEVISNLFEEKQAAAVDQQGRVIASLAQIENVLEQGLDLTHANRSADELAAEIRRLVKLKQQLQIAASGQAAAKTAGADQPLVAAERERSVSETLARIDRLGDFPSHIKARLDDAQERVRQAIQALNNPAGEMQVALAAAIDRALAAIDLAQAEAEAQLADARRRHKAVEVGELARAAEALERASSAERGIARLTNDAALDRGMDAKHAAGLRSEQADVAEVSRRIAAGVQNTAPSAGQMLQQTQPALADAANALDAIQSEKGETSKPAAAKARSAAGTAAEQLAAAAAALRTAQGTAAHDLEHIADEQLAAATAARQAVDEASELADASIAESLSVLRQARRTLGGALLEQAQAEGKEEEASAQGVAQYIDELARQQQQADRSAQELASGQANNPLDAASEQQAVADRARELMKQSPSEFVELLDRAATAAAQAARQTLAGSPTKAAAAKATLRSALAEATRLAAERLTRAAQAVPGEPNAAAQDRVAQQAGQAQRLIQQASAAAAQLASEALAQAQRHASAASQQLEAGKSAATIQEQTRQSLAEAGGRLDRAISDSAIQQEKLLNEQARRIGDLMEHAAQLDPGAAAALAQAQQAAERGVKFRDVPSIAEHGFQNAQKKLAQASANLAAREQQLRRDRDLAQVLAGLAADQQAARDAIATAAGQLDRSSPNPSAPSEQIAIAQALLLAQQQFAAAQTATGEGAAEISGQQEVANVPIREGLEIASRLGRLEGENDGGQTSEVGDQRSEVRSQKVEDSRASGDANPKSQIPNPKSSPAQPSQLGTGMIPAAPQITAKQIAGPAANSAAASALAAAMKGLGKGEPGQGQGESETPQEGAASSTAKKGGAAKGGKTAKNQRPPAGDLEKSATAQADSRGTSVSEDATVGSGSVQSEPWFAKLPAELRSAIQSKTRGKAPRGYEERLRRYFESVD